MISEKHAPPCFVTLGRFGDVMIILPGLKSIYDSSGVKPIVMVCQEFANIFNGVSYAEPHVFHGHLYKGVKDAIALACATYGDCIVPKWWDDPRKKPPPIIPDPWFKAVTLKYQGRTWQMKAEDWDSYMTSQWEHAGFTREQMLTWPLVFDRRNPQYEEALRQRVFKTDKPKLLYHFGGVTSPLPADAQRSMRQVMSNLSGKFECINLEGVRVPNIYDLLGIYDKAAGVITTDTCTLHLAGASPTPYIGLLANGGSGSVPRGSCVLKVRYHELGRRFQEVVQKLNTFA